MSWRYFKNSKQQIANLQAYDIVVKPIISEKSTRLVENNQYIFEVARDATKRQIALSVEQLFKVNVEKVTTSNLVGKVKRFRGIKGKLSSKKRAVVRLKVGQTIETT